MWSISRPGVPTTTSTGRESARTGGRSAGRRRLPRRGVAVFPEAVHRLGHLDGQFASRRENQRLRPAHRLAQPSRRSAGRRPPSCRFRSGPGPSGRARPRVTGIAWTWIGVGSSNPSSRRALSMSRHSGRAPRMTVGSPLSPSVLLLSSSSRRGGCSCRHVPASRSPPDTIPPRGAIG